MFFKKRLEDEEFTSNRDASLYRALAAENAVETHVLAGIGVFLFFVLLGAWNQWQVFDWHLLALIIPLRSIYKAISNRDKRYREYISLKRKAQRL